MAQPDPNAKAVVDEVERLKEIIGWSWIVFQKKLDWSPYHVTQFRTLKLAMPADGLRYIREVAAAVESVQPIDLTAHRNFNPTSPADVFQDAAWLVRATDIETRPQAEWPSADDMATRLARAGYHPIERSDGARVTSATEVRVMLLDDMAAKIARRYRALHDGSDPVSLEMNADERAGAVWAIGELAKELGVADEVRRLVSGETASAARPDPVPTPWASDSGSQQPERRPLS